MKNREKVTYKFRHPQPHGTSAKKEPAYRDTRWHARRHSEDTSLKLYNYPEKFSHPGRYDFQRNLHPNRYPSYTVHTPTTNESDGDYLSDTSTTTSTAETQSSYLKESSGLRWKDASVNTSTTLTSSYSAHSTSYVKDTESYTYSTTNIDSSSYHTSTSDYYGNSLSSGEHERALIIPFADHAVAMYSKTDKELRSKKHPYTSEKQSRSVSVGTSLSDSSDPEESFDITEEPGIVLRMGTNPLLEHYQSQARSVGLQVHTHYKMLTPDRMRYYIKVRDVSTQTLVKYRPPKLMKDRFRFVSRDCKIESQDPKSEDVNKSSDTELQIIEVQEVSQDDGIAEITNNGSTPHLRLVEPEEPGAEIISHLDLVKRVKGQREKVDFGPKRKLIIPRTRRGYQRKDDKNSRHSWRHKTIEMPEQRKFNVHTKVREKARDGNDADVSNLSEAGSIRTVSGTYKKSQAEMGIHRKFEIRERKETKIGRDIVEYDVITDEEDDARLDADHCTETLPRPSQSKDGHLKSVSEGYASGSEPSAMGVSSVKGSTPPVRRRVGGRYLKEMGASGPGSRDVGVQMQTTYIIPKEKIVSKVRDVGTQTKRSRHLLPQNPRILSDYSMERLRLLNSRENYLFDKENRQLYRVITKRTIIDSESDSLTTVSEDCEYDTLSDDADMRTVTETEVSDGDTVRSYDIHPTHKSHYGSEDGPKSGTRSVAVQMSTKIVVRKEGLPPVKVRDVTIQTKLPQPSLYYNEEGYQYSETIEKIWKKQVPFFPKRSLPSVESSILNQIDIVPKKRSSSPIIVPCPPMEGNPITSPRTPGRKTRLHRSASLPGSHRSSREIPRSHRESPRNNREILHHHRKSPRHRQESIPLTSSPRLIPFVDATEADIKPIYKTSASVLGPLSDTDLEVLETEPPKHEEIAKGEPNRANDTQKSVPVIDGSIVPLNGFDEEDKSNVPDLPDSPSPVQSVEITYTGRKGDGDQANPSDNTDKFQSLHHGLPTDVNAEPIVLEPELVRSETEDTYEFLEMLKTRRRRRRRKLKSPEQPSPGPQVLIRVGGGWMREEHHRIQHKPLHKHMKPTADGLPFVKSAYVHSYSKQPVVIKHKKDTELRYASFIP